MTAISGYAATFGRADSQADAIEPGAFRASLARRAARVPLLWQHDVAEPIGRVTVLQEDARGLWFSAELSATRRAQDALALLQGGALRECSIGFVPRRVRFEQRNGDRVRVLQELDLIEISLVTLAANADARVTHIDGLTLSAHHGPGPPPALPPPVSLWRRRLAAAIPAALPASISQ